jgi:hypothetical protein
MHLTERLTYKYRPDRSREHKDHANNNIYPNGAANYRAAMGSMRRKHVYGTNPMQRFSVHCV